MKTHLIWTYSIALGLALAVAVATAGAFRADTPLEIGSRLERFVVARGLPHGMRVRWPGPECDCDSS